MQPLTWTVKVLYGIGGMANALKNSVFALFIVYFYTSVMGLPATWVGAAAAVGVLLDVVVDPFVGHFIDARPARSWRQGLMLVGSFGMALSFWAAFSPPQGLAAPWIFGWLLLATLGGRAAMAVFTIPYFALGAELSHDYHERSSVAGIRAVMVLLGTLSASSLSFYLFFPGGVGTGTPSAQGSYAAMGLAFGVAIALTGVAAVAGTFRHRSAGERSSPPPASGQPLFGNLAQALAIPSFRVVFASFSLFFVGVLFVASLGIHYLTYYAGVESGTALGGFQFSFYIGSILGLPIWLALARVVDKHVLYVFGALASAAILVSALVLVGPGTVLGTGNVLALSIGHGIAGLLTSVVWFAPQSMIADVSDESELLTGERREGAFFGIFFLGRQLAVGLSMVLVGVLLGWFARFVPAQASQTPETVWRIGLLFSLVPATAMTAAALLMVRYGLSRRRIAAIRLELSSRRSAVAAWAERAVADNRSGAGGA